MHNTKRYIHAEFGLIWFRYVVVRCKSANLALEYVENWNYLMIQKASKTIVKKYVNTTLIWSKGKCLKKCIGILYVSSYFLVVFFIGWVYCGINLLPNQMQFLSIHGVLWKSYKAFKYNLLLFLSLQRIFVSFLVFVSKIE